MVESQPVVRIVVVTFNSEHDIVRCLDAIKRSTSTPFEIVVVDNASTDATVRLIRERHRDVQITTLGDNVGFAAAVNIGWRESRTPWTLLLNPDTEVTDGCLDTLVQFADAHPHHRMYGGVTLDRQGLVDARSAWNFPTAWSLASYALCLNTLFPNSRVFNPEVVPVPTEPTEVESISGCLLLLDTQLLSELHGLDERYFVYGEDVDLALRARKVEARPIVIPDARVSHAVGGSSDKRMKDILTMRGKVTFVNIHFGHLGRSWGSVAFATGVALRAAVASAARVMNRHRVPTFWIQLWADRRYWAQGWFDSTTGERLPLPHLGSDPQVEEAAAAALDRP